MPFAETVPIENMLFLLIIIVECALIELLQLRLTSFILLALVERLLALLGCFFDEAFKSLILRILVLGRADKGKDYEANR